MNNKAIRWLKRSDEHNRDILERQLRLRHMFSTYRESDEGINIYNSGWFIPPGGGKPEKIVGPIDNYLYSIAHKKYLGDSDCLVDKESSSNRGLFLGVLLFIVILTVMGLSSSCSTTSSRVTNSYVERCGSPQWSYRFNVDRAPAEDAAMENSARRNCLRFSGPDACLTSIEKVSNVDYVVTCSLNRRLLLKGNE